MDGWERFTFAPTVPRRQAGLGHNILRVFIIIPPGEGKSNEMILISAIHRVQPCIFHAIPVPLTPFMVVNSSPSQVCM